MVVVEVEEDLHAEAFRSTRNTHSSKRNVEVRLVDQQDCPRPCEGAHQTHDRRDRRLSRLRGRVLPTPLAGPIDVLLRHRRRSISRRSAAFHVKRRAASRPKRPSRNGLTLRQAISSVSGGSMGRTLTFGHDFTGGRR